MYKASREHWFEIIGNVTSAMENIASGIDCVNICDGRCCPRKMDPFHTGFIIFLPYEVEYIAQKWGREIEELEESWKISRSAIELDSGEMVDIAWARECPFLEGTKCSIYMDRPFDCRIFPVIPMMVESSLQVELASKCPEHHRTSSLFIATVLDLWTMLAKELPRSYWQLENKLVTSNSTLTIRLHPTNKAITDVV